MDLLISKLKTYYKQLNDLKRNSFPSTLKQALENSNSSDLAIIQAAFTDMSIDETSFIGLDFFLESPYITALLLLNTAGLLIHSKALANFNAVVSHQDPMMIANALVLKSEMQDLQAEMLIHPAPFTTKNEQISTKKTPVSIAPKIQINFNFLPAGQDFILITNAVALLNKADLFNSPEAMNHFNTVVSALEPLKFAEALILKSELQKLLSVSMPTSTSSITQKVIAVAEALDMLNTANILGTHEAHIIFNSVLESRDPHSAAEEFITRNILNQLTEILAHSPSTIEELLSIEIDNPEGSLSALKARLYTQMSIPQDIKLDLNKLLCYALEQQYSLVSDFFLNAIDISTWLQQPLIHENKQLARILIQKLMLSRMADPYDVNYQHIAKSRTLAQASLIRSDAIEDASEMTLTLTATQRVLNSYDQGKPLSDDELIEFCQSDIRNSEQAALLDRHNRYIVEAPSTLAEQEWLASTLVTTTSINASEMMTETQLSTYQTALSTLKMVGLFKKPEIELMAKVVQQFTQITYEGWQGDNVQDLLSNICDLLEKSNFDTTKTLEQAYLRPLLYILDDTKKVIPKHDALPIEHEKLVALKQLYQAVMRLNVATVPADVCVIETGNILHALLVLTEQKPSLVAWVSGIFSGKNDAGETVTLLAYLNDNLSQWMGNLEKLDQLMNLATFQALQTNLGLAAKTTRAAIEQIIFDAYQYELEEPEHQELMSDIANYMDLSQLNAQSGLIRHYPLLLIAAQHYDRAAQRCVEDNEKQSLTEKSNHFLSLAFNLRFMHQLSSVRNVPQLLILAEEMHAPVLSGTLGIAPQILAIFGVMYTAFKKFEAAENKVDFGLNLIDTIEKAFPEELLPWLSMAKIVLAGYPLIKAEPAERLQQLKEQEKKIKQTGAFAEEGLIALRLLVSTQYLSELSSLIKEKQTNHEQAHFSEILNTFLQPLAIAWEQHDITAAAIFVPKLIKSIEHIDNLSKDELSIEAYIKPILISMRETHNEFTALKQQKLLEPEESLVCMMIITGKNYLEVGSVLNQAYQTGRTIAKHTKSLKFIANGLAKLAPELPAASEAVTNINAIITTIQNGDLEASQTAMTQLTNTVSSLSHKKSNISNMAMKAGKASTSMLAVVGAVAVIANIGVTIYYGERALSEIKKVSDQLSANREENVKNHKKLTQQIEIMSREVKYLVKDLEQNVLRLTNVVELSTHNVLAHQKEMSSEFRREFELLRQAMIMLNESIEFVSLRDKIFAIIERSEIIEDAVQRNHFSDYTENELTRLYVNLLSHYSGLSSDALDGSSIGNTVRAGQSFFLQPLFQQPQPLPNLNAWMKCCLAITHFLNKFSESHFLNPLSAHYHDLQSLRSNHVEVVWITYDILQTLSLSTAESKVRILNLLEELKQNPGNKTKLQEMHLIARLCGLPLHQLGEDDFDLWSQVEGQTTPKPEAAVGSSQDLNEQQIQQKKLLENMIIETLVSIFDSKDTFVTCSNFTLSIQNLLMDLVNAGLRVFPDFSTALFEEHAHDAPRLEALVCYKSDQRLLSAQNSSCFFNIFPEGEITSSQLRLESK